MSQLNFMMITASPDVAAFIEQHGVARIFMDQEVLGKAERQGHLDTHKAAHTLEQIAGVASVLKHAELMVRLNPLHVSTLSEVDAAIEHGAQRLMLPMFSSRDEVGQFLELVNGRVPITFLAETAASLVRLPDWLGLLTPGYDEVHIGLNDLSLSMGLSFLFEPMAARLLDPAAAVLNQAGVTWGVGGVARIGQGELPAETVLGEHVRLGSEWIILSRAFHSGAATSAALLETLDFPAEIEKLRQAETYWRGTDESMLLDNQRQLAECAYRLGNRGAA
ncbi:aldolase/citrate lyase family protein [Vreelandella neptunia]|uniref:HpcH/HpaI aldolase/citrate lyase family protein n=1 Tax=Vreelandella neptunia TaxID=115551 RepID=A0ABS9S771_9GAMM|nr:aldolase/citrate lyase family protein [Halomonas neptunia]MCH4811965.1 HpcH/HpaI aldolase/citrate lyase family protein [Halomonas neptunia]